MAVPHAPPKSCQAPARPTQMSEGERVSRDCVRPSRNNKSSVYNHLVSSTDCCRTYSDSCFSVLCRARHGYLLQLQVLEAVCQRIHKPNLCVQKDSVITLKLFK